MHQVFPCHPLCRLLDTYFNLKRPKRMTNLDLTINYTHNILQVIPHISYKIIVVCVCSLVSNCMKLHHFNNQLLSAQNRLLPSVFSERRKPRSKLCFGLIWRKEIGKKNHNFTYSNLDDSNPTKTGRELQKALETVRSRRRVFIWGNRSESDPECWNRNLRCGDSRGFSVQLPWWRLLPSGRVLILIVLRIFKKKKKGGKSTRRPTPRIPMVCGKNGQVARPESLVNVENVTLWILPGWEQWRSAWRLPVAKAL